MNNLKSRGLKVMNLIRLILKEIKSEVSTTFSQKAYCYLKGFLAESSIVYNFKQSGSQNYLSDYARFIKTPFIDINYSYLIDNKFLFDLYFSNTIKSIGLIDSGLLFGRGVAKPVYPVIQEKLNSGKGLVLKPLMGGGGSGILFISLNNNQLMVNGYVNRDTELSLTLSSLNQYVLYDHFNQKGFSRHFYTHSLNTLRVLTMINPITNEPFIPITVHRFGTSRSGNVDNWSSGGICSEIDLETGKLSKAVGYPIKGKLEWHSSHPDSGVQIEGEIVPNWENIKQFVLEAAKKTAMIPYIGWDIVLSNEEIYILEANSNSDVNLLQVHRPLLSIPGVKEFFKYHKVL